MENRVLFLLNDPCPRGSWFRNQEEFEFQKENSRTTKDLVESYITYAKGVQGSVRLLDHSNYKQQEYEELWNSGIVIVNMCSGTEIDGWLGPSINEFLKKKKIRCGGLVSSLFLDIVDKKRLRTLLSNAGLNTKKFQVFKSTEVPKMEFPYIVRPADSYVEKKFLVREKKDLTIAKKELGTSFSLFIAEEYASGTVQEIFIMGTEFYCKDPLSSQVYELAEKTYRYLGTKGFLMLEIGYTQGQSPFVVDIQIVGILEKFRNFFGLEKTLQLINRMVLLGI